MSSGQDTPGGADLRRFTRISVNLDGYLSVGGGQAAPCTVRDFCQGGMFISAVPELYTKAPEHAQARLYFALIVEGEKQDFEQAVVIVRVTPRGVGVSFADPNPAILELLHVFAEATGSTPVADVAKAGEPGFAPEFAEISPPLVVLVGEQIAAIGARFLERVDEALFIAARDAGNNSDERRLLDVQQEVRGRGGRLGVQFGALIASGMSELRVPSSSSEQSNESADELSGLSLIDKDDFEEFLAISEAVAELEPKFSKPLFELGKRLSYLANREVDLGSNPLGPSALCNALAEGVKGLDAAQDAKSVVFRELHNTLSECLDKLYDAVNEFLVARGILPVVDRDKPAYKAAARANVGFDAPVADSDTEAVARSGATSEQDFADLMPGPEDYDATQDQDAVATLARATPVVAAAAPSPPSTAQPGRADRQEAGNAARGIAGDGAAAAPSGWQPATARSVARRVQRGYDAARAQMALRRGMAAPEGAEGHGAATAQPSGYSAAQLIAGLGPLQQRVLRGESALLGEQQVKQALRQGLQQDGLGGATLSDSDEDAIDLVANLFDALMRDPLVAADARTELARLQPAVYRAGLLDSGLFDSSEHPVRQVLDRVSRVHGGTAEEDVRQRAQVQSLLERVNRDFTDDVATFQRVVPELDAILAEQEATHRARVANVAESCEQQQQVLDARRGAVSQKQGGEAERASLPEEWNKWLERANRLQVGQHVLLDANTSKPIPAELAWREASGKLFVFVDDTGNKASSLTREQLAMYLRRGALRVMDDELAAPVVDRAMLGVVDRFHQKVESQATRDQLTGYLLRRFFSAEVDAALQDAGADAAGEVAMCHISLENLRAVNASFGDAIGDALLEAFAVELRKRVQSEHTVFGRLGGAALAIYWRSGGARAAHKRLQSVLARLRRIAVQRPPSAEDGSAAETGTQGSGGESITASFVIGVCGSDDRMIDAEGLLSAAREAAEKARAEGGDSPIHLAATESEKRLQLQRMVAYAEIALEKERLTLSGQHVISVTDSGLPPALQVVVGAVDRKGRTIPATMFEPALARCRNAMAIDRWVISRTLAWLLDNEDMFDRYALVIVPLSAASIKHEDLPAEIVTEFMHTPVQPGKICFSLPDHAVVENIALVADLVSTLSEYGCRFLLDEFGSGQSNYDYIKTFDADFVSVQSGFVEDAHANAKDFAMAKSINELAHFLGKKTIAKQAVGKKLGEVVKTIGIDFLHDKANRVAILETKRV